MEHSKEDQQKTTKKGGTAKIASKDHHKKGKWGGQVYLSAYRRPSALLWKMAR